MWTGATAVRSLPPKERADVCELSEGNGVPGAQKVPRGSPLRLSDSRPPQ